tara:strand:+ start:2488 stop:2736 length:249 start_codon:yes stop_codon:yes gene_type:complete
MKEYKNILKKLLESDGSNDALKELPEKSALRKHFIVMDKDTRIKYTIEKAFFKDNQYFFNLRRGDFSFVIDYDELKKYFKRA